MPIFYYKALDRSGKYLSGQINASSLAEASESLKTKALIPISVQPKTTESRGILATLSGVFFKVDPKSTLNFTRQLSVLLKSGIVLLDSIVLLTEQSDANFRRIVYSIKDDLKEGKSFASALERFPEVFSNVYIQLVRAGESSGKLETVLQDVATQLESAQKLQDQVNDAMRGPIVMIAVLFGVIIFAVNFILPTVANLIKDMGGSLPWITATLLEISQFLGSNWIAILIALLGLGAGFVLLTRTAAWKNTIDSLVVKIPIWSNLSKIRAVVQFSSTLGLLLEAGVNFSQALDIVCKVVPNKTLADVLSQARSNIIKEGKIAKHLEKTNIFPPIAFYMIKIGEESGNLSTMLLKVANDYSLVFSKLTERLVSIINPAMLVIVAAVILIVVIAIFSPMLQLANFSGI